MKYPDKISKLLFPLIFFLFIPAAQTESESVVLEDFEKYAEKNSIFDTWLLRENSKKEASDTYRINIENNNKFLAAVSEGNSIQAAKKIEWHIHAFPVISWRWRASALPDNANEDAKGKNDSGASVYVIFQRKKIPFLSWSMQPINVIKYVWSTTLPKGKVVRKEKKKAGSVIYEGYFFVVESGAGNPEEWITEQRNVLEDYKKVFGKNPKYDPYLIAILSDSNDTKSKAAADYDDIVIKKKID